MRNTEKKVTKKLAKEIAAKFFGRTVHLMDSSELSQRAQLVYYDNGYVFESGFVQLSVYPCYGSNKAGFEYPNKYPMAQILINRCCESYLKYVDGEFEFENVLSNEYIELKNALFTLNGLIEDSIDENHIHTNFDLEDRWIVKDKSKLLKALKILKETEKLL